MKRRDHSVQHQAFAPFILPIIFLLFTSSPYAGISHQSRGKIGFEYDDNTFEDISGGAGGILLRTYINSKLQILTLKRASGSVNYQTGAKRYISPLNRSGLSAGNLIANDLDLKLRLGLPLNVSASGGARIKHKKVFGERGERLSPDDGYLWGTVSFSLSFPILRPLVGTLTYVRSLLDFDSFDDFDRNGHQFDIGIAYRFYRRFKAGVHFKRKELDFEGAVVLPPESENPSQRKREDTFSQVGVAYQAYVLKSLVDFSYSYQRNSSVSFGSSYRSNVFRVIIVKHIPLSSTVQIYARIQTRRYFDDVQIPDEAEPLTDEDEQNSLQIRISKSLTPRWDIQTQYRINRDESSRKIELYTKGLYSVSLNYSF